MPIIIRRIKNNRINSRDSLNKNIPRIAVPTTPIPVQTAYAVPTGSVLREYASRPILRIIDIMVNTLHQTLVNPWEYFNPIAQATSNNPAINSINQFNVV
jgi:hypothetical protein